MDKKHKCKGIHKYTYGLGCGNLVNQKKRRFGLGDECGCFYKFTKTEAAFPYIKSSVIPEAKRIVKNNKDKKRKEFNQRKRELNSSKAMKNADTYFSRYIRLKYSKDGKCTCYTCGLIKDIKDIDNGHFEKRGNKATRYHEDNCRPQCKKSCNGDTASNGKQKEFRINLVNEIGEERVLKVEALARTSIQANYAFYKEKSDYYRIKVNDMQRQLKVKYW